MATWSGSVAQSNHDSRQAAGDSANGDPTNVTLFADTLNQRIGVIFDTSVPQASTVSAPTYVSFRVFNTSFDDPDIDWWGEAVDSPAVFGTGAGDLENRLANKTTATVRWTGTNLGNTVVNTADLSSIVQELVDRAGFNGRVCLIGKARSGSNARLAAYDNVSGYEVPSLFITYTPPSGTFKKVARVRLTTLVGGKLT